ncbi:coiled-coil domain-containing protein 90B, mitochondrial isoform X3 [Moschus berezovskii]|nr:coiled-coil domain-containing protein 90B, mitochondrial isoform X3 [Moschus berezovskii]
MVTQAQQEITVQQLMAHLDSIRKDMVILEKSEFANLRAENQKMKIELEQVKQQLINETSRIRADNKLDINLERSRVTDMFTDQEKKLMEATTEFTRNDTKTRGIISEIGNKIDTEIASLKTLMESNKLETIRYLAGTHVGATMGVKMMPPAPYRCSPPHPLPLFNLNDLVSAFFKYWAPAEDPFEEKDSKAKMSFKNHSKSLEPEICSVVMLGEIPDQPNLE